MRSSQSPLLQVQVMGQVGVWREDISQEGPQGLDTAQGCRGGTTGTEPQTAMRGPQVSLLQLPDADNTPLAHSEVQE